MKIIQLVTCTFSIAAFVFVFLIWENNKKPNFVDDSFLKSNHSDPIPRADAKKFNGYFNSNLQSITFPPSIFIDKRFIEAVNSNSKIDGVRIFWGAYDVDGMSPSQKPYVKNQATLILALTIGGAIQDDLIFDYGDPCKPPCPSL